jgi:hypothetical protein
MLKSIFSILVFFSIVCASAQNGMLQQMGSKMNQGGSSGPAVTMKDLRELRKLEKKDWSINYIKFSYDVMPTGRWLLYPDQLSQEFQVSASFYKYFFMVEAGGQSFTRKGNALDETTNISAPYEYNNSGRFFRLGPEVNLIKINPIGGAMTFGFRYARSTFSDDLTFTRTDDFENDPYTFSNDKANLAWLELTAGLNLIVWKNIHMGYTIRYKTFRKSNGIGKLNPFDAPGYGRIENGSNMGFSYYVGWAIPFKKEEVVPANGY